MWKLEICCIIQYFIWYDISFEKVDTFRVYFLVEDFFNSSFGDLKWSC